MGGGGSCCCYWGVATPAWRNWRESWKKKKKFDWGWWWALTAAADPSRIWRVEERICGRNSWKRYWREQKQTYTHTHTETQTERSWWGRGGGRIFRPWMERFQDNQQWHYWDVECLHETLTSQFCKHFKELTSRWDLYGADHKEQHRIWYRESKGLHQMWNQDGEKQDWNIFLHLRLYNAVP